MKYTYQLYEGRIVITDDQGRSTKVAVNEIKKTLASPNLSNTMRDKYEGALEWLEKEKGK